MKLLAIETTGPVSSVAIYDEGIITQIKNEDSFSHLKQLMPMVDRLMKEENCSPESLDAIAISQGPGSFTGIRIGMVSAKGLAQIWNKPIVEVPSLAAFAFRDYDWEEESAVYCPVIDAKMHQIYAGAYLKNQAAALVPANAYDPSDFIKALEEKAEGPVVFFADCKKIIDPLLENSSLTYAYAPDEGSFALAEGVAKLGSVLFAEGKTKSCFDAQPEYFRLPEAERKFRTKTMNLRSAQEKDIDDIEAIENESFSYPWSRSILLEEIKNSEDDNRSFVVAEDDGINAYVIFARITDDLGEIWSIATVPSRRRQGIARRLLLDQISKAKEKGIKTLQLEVRADNTPAICLYESLGFKKVGLRPGYYQGGEDAVLMDKDI